jgi:hypothetical protein
MGATHVAINTMGAGLANPEEHVATIGRFMQAAGAVARR